MMCLAEGVSSQMDCKQFPLKKESEIQHIFHLILAMFFIIHISNVTHGKEAENDFTRLKDRSCSTLMRTWAGLTKIFS